MSSFLQCSIELLNSYNFVKQKKCKRGLLKSKGSHPCLDCVFPPKFVEQPVTLHLGQTHQPPAAKSTIAPGAAQSVVPPSMTLEVLFWPEAAGGRGSQHQLHPHGLQHLCLAHSSSTAQAGGTAQPS